MLPLKHLTKDEHAEAARLLSQIQDELRALTRIVQRAPFTDRVMRVQKSVQERLIDPLREAEMEHLDIRSDVGYPGVSYAVAR